MAIDSVDLFKDVTDMVNSVADRDNLLIVIVMATMRVMGAKASSLILKDTKKERLFFHTCVGRGSEDVKKFELKMGEGIAGWVVEKGEAVLSPDVVNDPRWSSNIAKTLGFETQSIAAAPLKIDGETVGVLEVVDREDGGPMTEQDLELLKAFSDLACGLLVKAQNYSEVSKQNIMLKKELGAKFKIIGESPAIQEAIDNCRKVASSNATTLITGETGVGKEVFARLIHDLSPRSDKPMVVVNCGALPETLLERELFGHEKGAFTGADKQKIGLFEAADGSTIFLDEIGETSQAMQVKLLRVLQESSFIRIGGQTSIHVDVRVIAATNKELEKLVEEKSFREDLYYRLNVIRIKLPPLRGRENDVELMANFFLERFSLEITSTVKGFSKEAMEAMRNYAWPGNVRQLENTVERSVIMCESEIIDVDDLPPEIANAEQNVISVGLSFKEAQESFKRDFVKKSLAHCRGNKTKTAKMLDIQRTYLSRLIKELGVE